MDHLSPRSVLQDSTWGTMGPSLLNRLPRSRMASSSVIFRRWLLDLWRWTGFASCGVTTGSGTWGGRVGSFSLLTTRLGTTVIAKTVFFAGMGKRELFIGSSGSLSTDGERTLPLPKLEIGGLVCLTGMMGTGSWGVRVCFTNDGLGNSSWMRVSRFFGET